MGLPVAVLASLPICTPTKAMDSVEIGSDYAYTRIRPRQPVVAEEFKARYAIKYDLVKDGEGTSIRPRSHYLDALASNRPIVGIEGLGTPFSDSLPSMPITLPPLAKGGSHYDEIQLEIVGSRVDETPLPSMRTSPEPRNLVIGNDGWGPLRDARLEIGAIENSACLGQPVVEARLRSFELGDIGADYKFRLPASLIHSADIKEIQGNRICALGYLSYGGLDGTRHRTPFAAPVRAEESNRETFMFTGRHEYVRFEYDVLLPAGKTDYVKPVPVQEAYRNGGAFSLRLSSDRSAAYRINVRARLSDGSLVGLGAMTVDIVTPRTMRVPDLNPRLYTELAMGAYAPSRLSGMIRSITQNPDRPTQFLVHVSEAWERDSASTFDDPKISALSDSLARLGMPHGHYCIIYPNGECRQGGPFYWPGNWTQLDRSSWHSPGIGDSVVRVTKDPEENGDFSVFISPEWKRLDHVGKLSVEKKLISSLKVLRSGKIAFCYRGVGETGCIERVEAN